MCLSSMRKLTTDYTGLNHQCYSSFSARPDWHWATEQHYQPEEKFQENTDNSRFSTTTASAGFPSRVWTLRLAAVWQAVAPLCLSSSWLVAASAVRSAQQVTVVTTLASSPTTLSTKPFVSSESKSNILTVRSFGSRINNALL